MSYEALICPVVNIREHPNADRLVLGPAGGHQVILSKGTQEGTLTSPDDHIIDLSWPQMTHRCKELGLSAVPQIKEPLIYSGDKEHLLRLCEESTRGDSCLDDNHIREGIVLRVEAPGMSTAYYKKGLVAEPGESYCRV